MALLEPPVFEEDIPTRLGDTPGKRKARRKGNALHAVRGLGENKAKELADDLQINLKFSKKSSEEKAVYRLIQNYGRDKKKHIAKALNLYETLRRTDTSDGVDTAVLLLRSEYANVVMELQSEEHQILSAKIETLEARLQLMITKSDLENAVETITTKLDTLASKDDVRRLENDIALLPNRDDIDGLCCELLLAAQNRQRQPVIIESNIGRLPDGKGEK